jgi:poly(3-hydroxybutyrate) depolymerase
MLSQQDIGHDWPSTQANSDNSQEGRHPASFNASELILDFFAAHPLPPDGTITKCQDRRRLSR